jgi:hypothetical protein
MNTAHPIQMDRDDLISQMRVSSFSLIVDCKTPAIAHAMLSCAFPGLSSCYAIVGYDPECAMFGIMSEFDDMMQDCINSLATLDPDDYEIIRDPRIDD